MRKAIFVQSRATGAKGYVYYHENEDPKQEKLKVRLVDEKMRETGENMLCAPKNLTAIGYKD